MAVDLPDALIEAISEGRAVLFLGAGASRGARDEKGIEIEDGKGLANQIVNQFLGRDYLGYDFRGAYDLAASSRDVLTVQKFLFEYLTRFQPAPFHLIIPTIPWAGLLTTNYDLLIERAYNKSKGLQELVPHVKDDDGALDRLNYKSLLYVKLHGCITRHHEVHPPLVASTEQLIAFREGRNGQFDTFLEWAKTKTLIFVGYSFMDSNLRLLFDEIIKEGDNRPRHYIVGRGLLAAERGYWRDRRVEAISSSFEDFLHEIDNRISKDRRAIGVIARSSLHQTTFTRFITTKGGVESSGLKAYIGTLVDHVTPLMEVPPERASNFYRGFDLGWYSMKDNLDVHRTISNEIIREQIVPSPIAERPRVVILKGHAGSGKSVMLRRIAWDAAQLHDRICFFVGRQGLIDVQLFEEIFSLTNLPIFLFVDNVSEHKGRLLELFKLISRSRAYVKIICAESFVLWNALCDELESHVSADYEMRYLAENEIDELLKKLELHGSLGYLASLSAEKRKSELRFVHGRQLLVALLEATHGVPFVDILTEEYRSIPSNDARRLYLDICCLHRFGPPVRAGLISRLHDISFEDFKERLFRPLEQVIRLRQDVKSGDYVYESRHSHIAHELYQAILTKQEERFDNLVRIIRKLNPSFSYDLEVLGRLVRAENIRSAINDPNKGIQIYDAAIQSAGRRAVILHQRGIYELGNANNRAELDRAEESLSEALSMEPYNKSFKHSLAELALRRSRVASDPLERETWRQTAIDRASALTGGEPSPYPHHTILKAAIDEVRDSLASSELLGTEASMLHLGEAITKAEDFLRKALQQIPNDPALLGEEGELSNVLSQAPRAEQAFERAFQSNPKSTLLARRLSRIQRAKADFSAALKTLRTALESNPSNRELHYDVAMVLLESEPSADQKYGEDLIYHLRRAFSPGDKNFSAQFFYARQLCILGKYEDARPLFATLSEARIPYYEKTRIQGILKDDRGLPIMFSGTIVAVRPSFAFVESENPKMRVFVQMSDVEETDKDGFMIGFPVSFELAFNMKGPVAQNIRLLLA